MNDLIKLIHLKKFRAAENMLRKMLKESPEDTYVLTQLAGVLWNRYKDQEALYYADKAKELDPTNPLMMYTRGQILHSLEKFKQSIEQWDQILNTKEAELANNGYGIKWAKSLINDSRYYKADCLYHLFREKEAFDLVDEHLRCRKKGLQSDFTKKEVILFYKVLKYNCSNDSTEIPNEGYATSAQRARINRRLDALEDAREWTKIIRYLKPICKRYPKEYFYKTFISECCKKTKNKTGCLYYAKAAFDLEPTDPLVKYNYAVALLYNDLTDEALAQFEGLVKLGLDYIAYSEHGEGMRWAKKIMRHTTKSIMQIKQIKQI